MLLCRENIANAIAFSVVFFLMRSRAELRHWMVGFVSWLFVYAEEILTHTYRQKHTLHTYTI